MRKVKIIIQSDIFSGTKTMEEKDSFKFLADMRKHYEELVAANKLRDENFIDNGCLVTTHLLKEEEE